MVRVPVMVFPRVKSVLESIAFTMMVDAFTRDTFAVDAFKTDAFAVDAFKTDAFAVDAFIKVAVALLMLRTETFVGPKVRYPLKLVPMVIPSNPTMVLSVKTDTLRTDAFVVPSMEVEEFDEPIITEPVVKFGAILIDPLLTFVPTDNSDPAFIIFTVRTDTFNTDAFVVPSIVVELVEPVEPIKTFPVVKFGPIVMVPLDKFGPMDNSALPASKELTVTEDAFTLLAFTVETFIWGAFIMSDFNTDAFMKEEFKRVV
jgi:hypothetical protein